MWYTFVCGAASECRMLLTLRAFPSTLLLILVLFTYGICVLFWGRGLDDGRDELEMKLREARQVSSFL